MINNCLKVNNDINIQGINKEYIDFFERACDIKPMIQFPIYRNSSDCNENEEIIGYTCDYVK